MKELIKFLLLALTIIYLFTTTVSYIVIWLFDLDYNAFIVGFIVMLIILPFITSLKKSKTIKYKSGKTEYVEKKISLIKSIKEFFNKDK